MTTFRAYFYKGTRPGVAGIYNRAVRARFRGDYSHVELAFSDGWAASASFEDGGTRFKLIEFSTENWDYIDLPVELEPYARDWFLTAARMNQGYDVMGNLHLAFGFFPHSSNKFFCSEAVARALMIGGAHRFDPNALYVVLKRLVMAHNTALAGARRAA